MILFPKAIAKWRNNPSILAIASKYKTRANFSFSFIFLTEIKVLDISQTIQESGIPVKVIDTNENQIIRKLQIS